jgi:GNAT superfamily N-acetyltransferase
MVSVRPLVAEDVVPVAAALARAFDDDPIFRAILPDDAHRRRALPALFEEWTRILHLPHPGSFTTDDHAGAALWSPPGAWEVGIGTILRMGPRMLGAMGMRAWTGLRVMHAIESPHPKKLHHYLRVIGCDPARQGQGVGAALLRPILDLCDARREPAYLESSNERNHTFYRRYGFEVTGEVVTHLGPKAWFMWREPR